MILKNPQYKLQGRPYQNGYFKSHIFGGFFKFLHDFLPCISSLGMEFLKLIRILTEKLVIMEKLNYEFTLIFYFLEYSKAANMKVIFWTFLSDFLSNDKHTYKTVIDYKNPTSKEELGAKKSE